MIQPGRENTEEVSLQHGVPWGTEVLELDR